MIIWDGNIYINRGDTMKHMGTVTIKTNRLLLRQFTEKDASAMYYNWTSDEKVTELIPQTTNALKDLGADCQAKILDTAATKYLSTNRVSINTVEDYVNEALKGEFDQYDNIYHECNPTIADLLKEYLNLHQDSFIEIDKTGD